VREGGDQRGPRGVRRARAKRAARRRQRRALALLVAAVFAAVGMALVLTRDEARDAEAAEHHHAAHVKASARAHAARRVPAGPIPGLLLVADRGNNRMLLLDSAKHLLWRYPPAGRRPAYPFRFDDDAFFTPGDHSIVSNQEDQHTIQVISFPGGRVLWHYGHPDVAGSTHGYLRTPDDAYRLPNGVVTVADAYNCRVLFIAPGGRIVRQIGRAGACVHNPPHTIADPNGATPLPNGTMLISETVGSWVDAVTRTGRLAWSFRAPVAYPSDPQWLGHGHVLLADYHRPGAVVKLDTRGHVLWRYGPTSGPGMLDHPSLALPLPNGLIAVNDDYRHRVVVINPRLGRIVWQYGHTDVPGSAPGYLHTPDGMDLLPVAAARRLSLAPAAVHHARPAAPAAAGLRFHVAPFSLPAPVQREVAVPYGGRVLIAGGLDASQQSASGVFALSLPGGGLRSLGRVPVAFHDAAGALIGGRLVVFGGGAATSTANVQSFTHGAGAVVAHLPRPLSDLSAATVGGTTYLVGGYDGASPQTSIYATRDGRRFHLAGRLPVGLRYAGAAALGSALVVAGGETAAGPSDAVYRLDPASGRVSVLAHLPQAVGHAATFTLGDSVYVAGGTTANGSTATAVERIDAHGRVTRERPLPRPVSDTAAVVAGGHVWLVGGAAGRALRVVLVGS
jgi:outer membrane protein assembly factor BamB